MKQLIVLSFILFIYLFPIPFINPLLIFGLDLPLKRASGEMILGLGILQNTAYSPDGWYIATSGGIEVLLWDVKSGEIVRWYRSYTGPVGSVVFSSDGTKILLGATFTEKQIEIIERRDRPRTLHPFRCRKSCSVFTRWELSVNEQR